MKVGKKSEEVSVKMYQGVASLNILSVNPSKEELSQLLGREMQKDIQYLSKDDAGNDRIMLSLWCKTDKDSGVNNGIELILPVTFSLVNTERAQSKSGKIQVIDKYGRSAWVTPEEFDSKAIPQYASGPANISSDYHRAMPGEETLMELMKSWLNIPDVTVYNSNSKLWEPNSKVEAVDCEMSLDYNKLFKGDVSEISSLIKDAAGYAFKAAIGIRTDDKGYQHQNVYTGEFLKNGARKYDGLMNSIISSQTAGSYSTTEFDCKPLHEYSPKETSFEENSGEKLSDDNPWA